MCCRLNMDTSQLINRPGGMWGPGDATGSIGVITINVNRLGFESKQAFSKSLSKNSPLGGKEVMDIKKARIALRQKLSEKGRRIVNKFERSTAPVIGYFFAKENEVDNLRIIARGKHSGLSQELIEQQLVY